MPTSTVMSLLRGNSKDEIFEVFSSSQEVKTSRGVEVKLGRGVGDL